MDSYLRLFGRGFLLGRRDVPNGGGWYYTVSYLGGTFEFKDSRDLSALLNQFCEFSVLCVPRTDARVFNDRQFVVTSYVPAPGCQVDIQAVRQ